MVLNNIEKLLEKYENGETTLKEEETLKKYFLQNAVAPHLEMYKPMFAYFSVNQEEQFTKQLSLKTKQVWNYKWIAIAAVAVLMFGIYLKKPVLSSYQEYAYGTYNNPEEALNEVMKSLEMISNQFNKGTFTLGYLNEVENTTSIIFKK